MISLQSLAQSPDFKKRVIVLFFALSAFTWFCFWVYGHFYLSTDNAYVGAHTVQIAPRITGQVAHLAVANNQYVHAGDVLFEIDAVPFQIAVDSAKAQLAISQAQLQKASLSAKRTITLAEKKYSSMQDEDNAVASLRTAEGNVELANATLQQAMLNLQYTKITSPTSGWVTNLSLRSGDIVLANQSLFALISNKTFWVDANFKETEMASIKAGQAATIHVDMYPNHSFNGIVESISGGAGAAFSLLPPQNATGNWVKVTQRVPVRIRIINPDTHFPLRVGTSANVTISLHKQIEPTTSL